ncbi:MAG: PD-(D/E)XK nuclease family protein [Eubacteriaceae bacterium]|jgi:hypothetical protein|nr:PD-(D/E)XK nuclease family protein [Eubacteriaceae bacterium]
MTVNEEQALKDFLLDIDCLRRLDDWTDDFNLFDVLKITNAEIRHSNILGWFFDPNENHGMGDRFIKTFATKVAGRCNPERYDAFQMLLQDFFSYQVYRESNHMDIVLVSKTEKTAYIIENKVWSGESSHQLKDYLDKSKTEYKDCNQVFYIFLTPDGRKASDPDNWISFSYEEIIECLESAVNGINLKDEVLLVVKNYTDTVRKSIMKEKDEKLVSICNEIYNKHRTALRLIFENVSIDSSVESEIIRSTLQELEEDSQILYKGSNKWQFFTEQMDKFLPELDSSNSSWGTNWVYYYWFTKPSDDKLRIYFEIGGWNLTDDLSSHTDALIRAAGKNKRDGYQYMRLYRKDEKLSENNYEESLREAVKSLVKAALANETKLLAKAEELLSEDSSKSSD